LEPSDYPFEPSDCSFGTFWFSIWYLLPIPLVPSDYSLVPSDYSLVPSERTKKIIRRYQRGNQKVPKGHSESTKEVSRRKQRGKAESIKEVCRRYKVVTRRYQRVTRRYPLGPCAYPFGTLCLPLWYLVSTPLVPSDHPFASFWLTILVPSG
jgi:hypothetical protein